MKTILNNKIEKRIFLLALSSMLSFSAFSQNEDSTQNERNSNKEIALNIPVRTAGISFGNSHRFSGIRFNLADKEVVYVNGINFTLWRREQNKDAKITGVSIGIIPSAGQLTGINFGLFGIEARKNTTGISFGGFGVGTGNDINGLAIGGLGIGAGNSISGIAIGGLGLGAGGDIKGLSFGGLGIGAGNDVKGISLGLLGIGAGRNITGFSFGGLGIGAGETIKGMSASLGVIKAKCTAGIDFSGGYMKADTLKGIAISSYINTNETHGLSIAVFNRSQQLHGIQFGLLNYAGNNSAWSKWLPILNMHWKK